MGRVGAVVAEGQEAGPAVDKGGLPASFRPQLSPQSSNVGGVDLTHAITAPDRNSKDFGDPLPDGLTAIAAARIPKKRPEHARRP
jgi:hypothetical protein